MDAMRHALPSLRYVRYVASVAPITSIAYRQAECRALRATQPEEFKQFFANAYGGAPRDEKSLESEKAIAAVYDLFVGAKVMRR